MLPHTLVSTRHPYRMEPGSGASPLQCCTASCRAVPFGLCYESEIQKASGIHQTDEAIMSLEVSREIATVTKRCGPVTRDDDDNDDIATPAMTNDLVVPA